MRLTPHRLKHCPVAELRCGDHVAVRRPEGYVHHGIFVGEGRVAHFSDDAGLSGKGQARVQETSLEAFLRGGGLLRRRHRRALPRELVVARARGVLRGEIPWRPYHLVRNNCEHFATFCAAKRTRSVQVQQVAGAAVAVTTVLGATFLKRRLQRRV